MLLLSITYVLDKGDYLKRMVIHLGMSLFVFTLIFGIWS